ncbi:MAG: ATP-binding protein [Xanthobacteraceae bacterium]
MVLQHLALDQIDQAQLQRLIDGRASETRDIDYKRDTYGNADRDYGEFLADIPSFANTAGGDIIIGMSAESGIPTGFVPLEIDLDAEILRLENVARSGLQPRISGLAMRGIPIVNAGSVLVIRIPKSYNQPHRVVRQGSGNNRFYARSSAGKYEPNVDELRLLFAQAPQLAGRIRDFRADRIAKIAANQAPVPLLDAHALIIHVIPFSAFDSQLSLPLDPGDRLYMKFQPILSSYPNNFRINLDGLLTLSNAQPNAEEQRAYVQVFHSGIVEAVASSFLQGDGSAQNPFRLTALRTEAAIVKFSHIYMSALLAIGCAPPFALLTSLIGVKNAPYSFTRGNSLFEDEAGILDRDQLHFSEIIVEEVPQDRYEYAKRLRPLLDQTANAAGRATTPSFDHTGAFRLRID